MNSKLRQQEVILRLRDGKYFIKTKTMEIEKVNVSSSVIEAIGYDQNSEILRVWFLNRSVYDYFDIGAVEVEALRNATSIGSYLAKNIKGLYHYKKVR